MSKVGIVILNFNSTDFLKVTLKSVLLAKGNTSYAVGVIDNGSEKNERDACESYVRQLATENPNVEIRFFDEGRNLGFSGGNNVVIKAFLEQKDITHLCLLNSDVIVTDFWLDYLLEKNCDVIGPVTNAAGNEQTIQIDYNAEPDENGIKLANDYARRRHESYRGYVVASELVTFFATVIKREVIEKIGLLDEQFYPGSYEDDDYCVRILEAGYGISIARDCFLHHFGSGSFSKLNMNERKNIGNINRERFEKKWNRPWKDRTWKMLESCKQDMDYLLQNEGHAWEKIQIDASLVEMEKLLEGWGEAIRFFTARADQVEVTSCEYSAKQLVGMLGAKVKRKIGGVMRKEKTAATTLQVPPEEKKKIQENMERIYALIAAAAEDGHKPICVFAPMYNKENEKDGYVQRIKAIDQTVLKNMCRIYLYDEGNDCRNMRFDFIDDLHGYIVFNSHNEEDLQMIKDLAHKCGTVYTHSILRFMGDRTAKKLWDIFDDVNVTHFWDVHGTVPEEYKMSGSDLGSEMANEIESFMAARVDVVVVVTKAMGDYLKKKYPFMQAQIVIVPILNPKLLEKVECHKNMLDQQISIVYAGGTQPWQNIELMQDIVAATGKKYHYKMFVPDPDEFMKLWGQRYRDIQMSVLSKTPDELYQEYESCDFGFVLRDSDPVNLVACPTKMLEYLRYGIVPILKSTQVGDFVDMGMKYIPYTDVISGIRITEDERKAIVEQNYKILDELSDVYRKGITGLEKMVELGVETSESEKQNKPAIGIVVTTFDKGGLEQVVLNLYFGYKKKGYPVYMLCQKNILGIMAKQVDAADLFVFDDSIKSFIRFIRKHGIDVLHYHYNTFGCEEAKKSGVHTIYTMHNVYTWKNNEEIREYSKVLDKMDYVIPVSNLVKNYYLARTKARKDNLQVVYNGIDFRELDIRDLPHNLERSALGLKDSDIVLGFVASFYPVKYQIGMIGVMEELSLVMPEIKLLFIGNCENEYHEKFMKEYENSSAKDSMIHVPYFEHKYMGEFLRRVVDIFTLPSLQEGCSNAVLEAIYCDKPMVLTNVGNAMDVADLESCEVVNPAYKDIVTTSNEEIMKISEKKDSANKKDLIETYLKVARNLKEYKEKAVLSPEKKSIYATDHMVEQYISIIESIRK